MSTIGSWTPRTTDTFSISIPALFRAQKDALDRVERERREAQQAREASSHQAVSDTFQADKPASLKD